MEVTPSGIVTEVSEEQPLNALTSIEGTPGVIVVTASEAHVEQFLHALISEYLGATLGTALGVRGDEDGSRMVTQLEC